MLKDFLNSKIAIVGGGNFCKNLLEIIYNTEFDADRPSFAGVADTNKNAEGMLTARKLGIPTTTDYRDFFKMPDLQILMELTPDFGFSAVIGREKPAGLQFIDHIEARSVWSALQLEKARRKALKVLHATCCSGAGCSRYPCRRQGYLSG